MRCLPSASLLLLAACGIHPVSGVDATSPAADEAPDAPVTEPAAPASTDATMGDAPVLAEASTELQDAPSLVAGAWVVRLKDGASIDDGPLAEGLQEVGAADVAALAGGGAYRFHSDAAAETIDQLAEVDAVAWVEPVVRMMPLSTDDPYYEYQWHLPQLNVPQAWAYNQGAGAVVAVVDTGVLRVDDLGLANADGIANLLPAKEYVPVSPVLLNETTQVEIPDDDVGHGTHIASTIAQRTDNGVGGAGIAPDASILPIRALGQLGGTSTDVADAIRYAADNGADVINLSLGSPLYTEIIAEACDYAADQGVVLIAASGNDAASFVSYPAALDSVLAVGAVGPDWNVTDYSNTGAQLDVVAPGGVWYDYDRNGLFDGIVAETWQVWTGVEGVEDGAYVGGYFLTGTSMATATVSGVAALLVSEGATRDEVMSLLTSTAVDLGSPGWDADHGFGMVDAAAALEAYAGPPPEPTPELLTVADLAPGDLVVTEYMPNPTWCAGDSCEWFEVRNATDSDIDLDGLVVEDAGGASGTVGTVVVAPGAVAVVGRGSDAAWDHPDITPDAFYGTAVTLNNGGDELRLSNGGGELASVDWSDSEAGISWTLADSEWVLADTVADALPVSGEFATPGE